MDLKTTIEKLIWSKSDRITYTSNKGKSKIWQDEKFLQIHLDSQAVPYMKCQGCSAVLKWKARDGTNGLKGHFESCKGSSGEQKLTAMFGPADSSPAGMGGSGVKRHLSMTDKQNLADSMVCLFCLFIYLYTD